MKPCPICQNRNNLSYWHNTEYIFCPNCQFVYIAKIPNLEELEQNYSEDYFSGNIAYRNYELDRAILQKNFKHRIQLLHHFKPSGELFEIGCAFGFFLECAQAFWDVKGCDISYPAVAYAQKKLDLNVKRGDFEHIDIQPESLDIIAMWDVIEHLHDPVLAIAKCSEALKDHGILALTTGDIGALMPRIQKQTWRMIIPEHLYHFSKPSITVLLEQHNFEIIHFSHPGNYRSLSQLAHILTWQRTETGWRGTALRWFEKLPIVHWGLYVNLHDIMFVIAQKKATRNA